MLEDISIISETIESGGVLAMSFHCDGLKIDSQDTNDSIREQLIKMVGNEYVENNIDPRGWKSSEKIAVFLKNCVMDKINSVLKKRNLSLFNGNELQFQQKLFFRYADGAPMITIAYVFSSIIDQDNFKACNFSDLYFVRESDEPFNIITPNLTVKEIRHLMEIRPIKDLVDDKIFVEKDVKALWDNYRYFPGFSEIESF